MDQPTSNIVTAVITVLIGGAMGSWFQRRKTSGDAYASLTNALHTMGLTLNDFLVIIKQVPQLQHKVEDLEKTIADWRVGIGRLLGQLCERNIVPVWKPDGVELPGVKTKKNGGLVK